MVWKHTGRPPCRRLLQHLHRRLSSKKRSLSHWNRMIRPSQSKKGPSANEEDVMRSMYLKTFREVMEQKPSVSSTQGFPKLFPGLIVSPPIFHEGSKGYSCCKRKVLEFDEYISDHYRTDNRFLKIPGCTTSAHRFQSPPSTLQSRENTETVQCREDFYQTQQTCVLAVFAKKIDPSSVNVMFSPRQLSINFEFAPQKRYTATIPLYGEIDPEKSRYEILSMKLEITMKKANRASWPVLRPDPNVTEKFKFGVDSRNNTS